MKTTEEFAHEKHVARRTIQNWCARLGIKKSGRDYLLTVDDEIMICERLRDKPGRPPLQS